MLSGAAYHCNLQRKFAKPRQNTLQQTFTSFLTDRYLKWRTVQQDYCSTFTAINKAICMHVMSHSVLYDMLTNTPVFGSKWPEKTPEMTAEIWTLTT